MLFDIITAYQMKYLTLYLNRNLKIPATWDGLFDMLNCIIVLSQTLVILLSREIFLRTHSVMNNDC